MLHGFDPAGRYAGEVSGPPPFPVLEQGWERDRLFGADNEIRWWFFVYLPDEAGRPQRPRQGVQGRGFRFARGGRCTTADEAAEALSQAADEAQQSLVFWRGQPSHALGVDGNLVPLGETAGELAS